MLICFVLVKIIKLDYKNTNLIFYNIKNHCSVILTDVSASLSEVSTAFITIS